METFLIVGENARQRSTLVEVMAWHFLLSFFFSEISPWDLPGGTVRWSLRASSYMYVGSGREGVESASVRRARTSCDLRRNWGIGAKLVKWRDPVPIFLTLRRWYLVQTWHWTWIPSQPDIPSSSGTQLTRRLSGSPHQPNAPFRISGTLRILFEAFTFFSSNFLSHACIFLS